jgi:hypothetical protein
MPMPDVTMPRFALTGGPRLNLGRWRLSVEALPDVLLELAACERRAQVVERTSLGLSPGHAASARGRQARKGSD